MPSTEAEHTLRKLLWKRERELAGLLAKRILKPGETEYGVGSCLNKAQEGGEAEIRGV